METTAKEQCNIVADVLINHGVKRFVISPGSRNAPLIVALARRKDIERYVVVDERSAAFIALGLAQQTSEPVGIVCTSGTALLNYAPAVAEAYYQKLPIIVISADRPREWIDQDDSQTIRQFEALGQFVKKSYNLPSRCNDDTARWYANRIVNDAITEATRGQNAPVHINVEINEPLNETTDIIATQRIINAIEPSTRLDQATIDLLATEAKDKNILIIAGFGNGNSQLSQVLGRLSQYPNISILTETIANVNEKADIIHAIDRTLLAMGEESRNQYTPDLLITIGGALISRIVKNFLRNNKPKTHWHIGITDTTVDCMQSLTKRILSEPHVVLEQIESRIKNENSSYHDMWKELAEEGLSRHNDKVTNAPWSDLKAFATIIPAIPAGYHVQLSNGTTIRYAQLFGDRLIQHNNCNRGVSGIDGSTSTALGASLAYPTGNTLLITGDMSFSYDLSGLASQYNSPRFKIIVIKNGGGGIFRFIKNTSSLPELENYLEVSRDIPVGKYAEAFGFNYYEANSEESLKKQLPIFFADADKPSILAVISDKYDSAKTLKNYFSNNK